MDVNGTGMGVVAPAAMSVASENIVSKSGPLFLSALFHWGCFGVLCTQFFIYISGYSKDPLRNKLFVYTIVTLEVVQTIILTRCYFEVFGYGFGQPEAYDRVGGIWFSISFLSGIVAFLAEMFYAMRLYRLSNSYRVPIIVSALALTQVAGAIFNSIVLKDARLFSKLPQGPFKASNIIWAGGSALCDVVIAFFMTRYLWMRRKEGTKTTQIVINRIIRLVLETGSITAFFAVVLLVLTMLPDHISYYQVPAAILAKLYSNSMLALLNSRSNLNLSQDVETAPVVAPQSPLRILQFVETFHEPADALKAHEKSTSSGDTTSIESG